jgi:hypothetical protein
MPMEAHPALDGDCYLPARAGFEQHLAWLRGPSATMDFAAFEEELNARGEDLKRRLCQGWLDERSRAEAREHARTPSPEGVAVRPHTRDLEASFGRVSLRRLGHKVAGRPASFPLDKQLNLPAKIYSHPLQQRVVEEARDRSWDRAVERVDRTTAGHVPKRQAQQLAIHVTQDVDEFYKQREAPKSTGNAALLMGSMDCKGVRSLPGALREATRRAAAAEKASAVRGDPMARKKPRSHDKRMAAVAAAWEEEPLPRTASDIVSELSRMPKPKVMSGEVRKIASQPQDEPASVSVPELSKASDDVSRSDRTPKAKGRKSRKADHRPQNKRVWASVKQGVSVTATELFDEFDRRDPERVRKVGVLVDGDENQQTAILEEQQKRGRVIVIILDIIHVIHYLWLAGYVLCRKDRKKTDLWVATHLLMLLSTPVAGVIAAIETAAATRTLSARGLKSVNKALGYLRRNAPFLDYPTYLAQGFPIATGVIEGACRHLIQDRLGITGAKWGLDGAEAMLRLRALYSSGDWDNYWRFHLKQEALRNYAPAA